MEGEGGRGSDDGREKAEVEIGGKGKREESKGAESRGEQQEAESER